MENIDFGRKKIENSQSDLAKCAKFREKHGIIVIYSYFLDKNYIYNYIII